MQLVDAPLFIRGILIGFAIAAPVGPIGVLCIQRTLTQGRLHGLVSGLGAASADALYGSVAAFGLTIISSGLLTLQTPLRLVGGLYLCYLGIRTLRQKTIGMIFTQRRNIAGAYLSTLGLTLTNPMTIMSFVAIFAGLGVGVAQGDLLSGAIVVIGVFGGSALWWLLLTTFAGFLTGRMAPRLMQWIKWIAGAIILAFGAASLLSLLF